MTDPAQILERWLDEARDAEELFAGRPKSHQLQALVSRQGEAIEDPRASPLRARRRRLDRHPPLALS
jgi:pyridoxine/pyridoxamine 5'-phosphate oxidase